MAENDQPPAPPVGAGTLAPPPQPKPEPTPKLELEPEPTPPKLELEPEPTPPKVELEPELLPTIRDHAERLLLKPWQVSAIVARLHGSFDDAGVRIFADGASLNTRMSADDFDKAVDVALYGRV